MKKLIVTLFLCLAFLLFQPVAFAQTVHGCVLPGSNVIYKNKVSGLITDLINGLLGGASLYTSSPNETLANPNCFYKPLSGTTPCKVCPTGLSYNIL